MGNLSFKSNPEVKRVFAKYPEAVREKMQFLRVATLTYHKVKHLITLGI